MLVVLRGTKILEEAILLRRQQQEIVHEQQLSLQPMPDVILGVETGYPYDVAVGKLLRVMPWRMPWLLQRHGVKQDEQPQTEKDQGGPKVKDRTVRALGIQQLP